MCMLAIAIAMPSCVYDYEGDCEGDYFMRLTILNHWSVTPEVFLFPKERRRAVAV